MPKPKLPRTDTAWDSSIAYVVGLITTDGNLSSDQRHVILTSSDPQLLETFKTCLNKKNSISLNPSSEISRKQSYKVQIGDVVLYDWLKKIGLSPNKSLKLGPINIPNKYFRDFLRGHLDGDGSIIHYIDRYNTYINPKYVYERLFLYFISASKRHLLWLRRTINNLQKISGSFHTNIPRRTARGRRPTYLLKFSTKEAKLLLNWIYYKKGLPCLERKYVIAKPFLHFT